MPRSWTHGLGQSFLGATCETVVIAPFFGLPHIKLICISKAWNMVTISKVCSKLSTIIRFFSFLF